MDPFDASVQRAGIAVRLMRSGGIDQLYVELGGRRPSRRARAESGWWSRTEPLVVAGRRGLGSGVHAVAVDFQLLVPYLQARPGRPLVLPFHLEAQLELTGVNAQRRVPRRRLSGGAQENYPLRRKAK